MSAFSAAQQGEAIQDTLPLGSLGNLGWTVGFQRTNFLEAMTDTNYLTASAYRAFNVFGRVVNPGANATILHHFMNNTGNINPAYKTLIISCSAACEIFINRTSALGTTCTALTIRNEQLGNNNTVQAAATGDQAENACATQPTATYQIFDLQLPASSTYTLDLSGFVNFHNVTAGGGIDVVNNVNMASGNVAATLLFAEAVAQHEIGRLRLGRGMPCGDRQRQQGDADGASDRGCAKSFNHHCMVFTHGTFSMKRA